MEISKENLSLNTGTAAPQRKGIIERKVPTSCLVGFKKIIDITIKTLPLVLKPSSAEKIKLLHVI